MTWLVDYVLGFMSIAMFNMNAWYHPRAEPNRTAYAYTDDDFFEPRHNVSFADSDDDEWLLVRKIENQQR